MFTLKKDPLEPTEKEGFYLNSREGRQGSDYRPGLSAIVVRVI